MRILKPKEVISWPTFYSEAIHPAQVTELRPFNKPKLAMIPPNQVGLETPASLQHKVTAEIKSHQLVSFVLPTGY